ncbi:MAG TPA: hypothetical protein VL201_03790, partial [Patescibacteria group bacterium]|nr:hypothetical protein [Patescibacteria group bacterium]
TIDGMECIPYNLNNLTNALQSGNLVLLKTMVNNKAFDPNTVIIQLDHNKLNSLEYFLIMNYSDENIVCAGLNILCDAKVPINPPSDDHQLTAFHFVKTIGIFDYLIKKAEINDPKNILDFTCTGKNETIFESYFFNMMTFEELEKIYNAYQPKVFNTATAGSTILHDILSNYLLVYLGHLRIQSYNKEVFQITGPFISPDGLYLLRSYSYTDETFKKIKLLIQNASIDCFKKNKYNQTPYEFYVLLLDGLKTNDLDQIMLIHKQYKNSMPEYEKLITWLFERRFDIAYSHINLSTFFNENLKFSTLLKQLIDSKITNK